MEYGMCYVCNLKNLQGLRIIIMSNGKYYVKE